MNATRTKLRVVSLSIAALLSLSLAVPALASPVERNQRVILTGTVVTTLSFAIDNTTVAFGAVDPLGTANNQARSAVDTDGVSDGACYVANTAVHLAIKSNHPYNGFIFASRYEGFDAAGLGLNKVHWSSDYADPHTYQDCAATSSFPQFVQQWTGSGPTALTEHTFEYALQVDWQDRSGTVGVALVYGLQQF